MRPTIRILLVSLSLLAAGCGTTSVNRAHPLLTPNSGQTARVYFLRPDEAIGMRRNAAAVRLADAELLTISPGHYCVVDMQPYAGNVLVESSFVERPENTLRTIKETRALEFRAGQTHYVLLEPTARGYAPIEVTADAAREAAATLAPVGAAANAPLED